MKPLLASLRELITTEIIERLSELLLFHNLRLSRAFSRTRSAPLYRQLKV
jgi:hypothetical protein